MLSDGFRVPGLPVPSLPVIGGDAAAACIAAASVLAKVSRDRLMVSMDSDHPGYGFAEHKGYSTPSHATALAERRAMQPAPAVVHQRPAGRWCSGGRSSRWVKMEARRLRRPGQKDS